MARRVFYSFHYEADNWRTSQVRNIGALEGNKPANDNDWESIKKGGDKAIKRWIDGQLYRRTCTIVLVGANTAGRKWINYEIRKSWNDGRGLVGIRIHGLKNQEGRTARMGKNPFNDSQVGNKRLSSIVRCINPEGDNSISRYRWIAENLEDLVEEAIEIRNEF